MKKVTKSVKRKFIEMTIQDLCDEMYIATDGSAAWTATMPNGEEVDVNTSPSLRVIDEKAGTVKFELMSQTD